LRVYLRGNLGAVAEGDDEPQQMQINERALEVDVNAKTDVAIYVKLDR
jgi:hypothetical protein